MIGAEVRDSLLGILFAFFLGIACIVAAVIMVFLVPQNGGAIAGAILGVTGIGSITSSFILSARGERSQNNANKRNKEKKSNDNKNT